MNTIKSKSLLLIAIICCFYWITASAVTASGRNTSKEKSPSVVIVDKVTKLAAKSHVIKKYGRNIKILSNKSFKSSSLKQPKLEKYFCRRVVLMTEAGERKTVNICGRKS
jgi:hypothetical protein